MNKRLEGEDEESRPGCPFLLAIDAA